LHAKLSPEKRIEKGIVLGSDICTFCVKLSELLLLLLLAAAACCCCLLRRRRPAAPAHTHAGGQ
jgi:hypothetical protein